MLIMGKKGRICIMKKSISFILVACFWLAASAGFAAAPPYAGTTLFVDTFTGTTGTPPSATNWTCDNGGALDGSGNYVKTNATLNTWLPLLVGKTNVVPGTSATDIQVEFRVSKTTEGNFALELFPSAGTANTLAREFIIESDYGRINVDTDLAGGVGGVTGGGNDWTGINTSLSYNSYAENVNIGLIMILKTSGVIEYWYDNGGGGGYTQVTVVGTGQPQGVMDILNSWTPGTPPSYQIKVTSFSPSTGTGPADTFKVDRITVTQLPGPNSVGSKHWSLFQ